MGLRRPMFGFGADFGPSFSDLFDGIFGMGGGRGTRAERTSDLHYNMEITLEEAFVGKTAKLRLPTSVSCEACSGTGAKVGTRPKACPDCGGAGRIRYAQGLFTLERTCAVCQGRGRVIDNPCPTCLGAGPVTRERTLSVVVFGYQGLAGRIRKSLLSASSFAPSICRRLQSAGYDVADLSYALFTYDDGTIINLGVSCALPEKYPALGHAARVDVLGTEGVMILDDDHTDQLMYSEKGVPHVYLPDHSVNMVFPRAVRRAIGRWANSGAQSQTKLGLGSITCPWANPAWWRRRKKRAQHLKQPSRSSNRWRPGIRLCPPRIEEFRKAHLLEGASLHCPRRCLNGSSSRPRRDPPSGAGTVRCCIGFCDRSDAAMRRVCPAARLPSPEHR